MISLFIFSFLPLPISGYSFEDVFYNEMLAADFELLDDFSNKLTSHSRTRRGVEDVKCRRHFDFCCNGQMFRGNRKELVAIAKKCFDEVNGNNTQNRLFDPFSCEGLQKRKTSIICIKQCVAQQKGLVDPSGNLKEDAVMKYITEHNTLEWLKPKLDDIIMKCLTQAKNGTGNVKNPDKTSSCNPAEVNFSRCMFREVQSACPADQVKNPQRCKKFLESFERLQSYYNSNRHDPKIH